MIDSPDCVPVIFCDDVLLLAEHIYCNTNSTSRIYQAAVNVIKVAKLGAHYETALEACDRALEILA